MPTGAKRIAMIAVPAVLAVLLLAWLDGGYEPVRPMEIDVPVPAKATVR